MLPMSVLNQDDLLDERIPVTYDSDALPHHDVQTVKWERGKSNKYRVAVGADLRFKKGCCVCGGCCVVTKGNCSPGRKVVRGPGHSPPENMAQIVLYLILLQTWWFLHALIACRSRSTYNTDWEWGNQDGGSGKTGVLQDFSVDEDGWIVSYYLPFCS